MADLASSPNHFRNALEQQQDITASYLELGDLPQMVGISTDLDDQIINRMRELLNSQTPGIEDSTAIAAKTLPFVSEMYRNDLIAAVDGTDAISPLRFVSETLYATGVVRVTPASVLEPRATITRTRATAYNPANDRDRPWTDTIREWAEYLRNSREHELSWVNSFREFQERSVAVDWVSQSDDKFALIDGPLLTQNLLTQSDARNLLKALTATGRTIGFIKELSSNPLLIAIGHALGSGEHFVLAHWSALLRQRFRNGQSGIANWINDNASEIVRVVYKTNRKPYAIECCVDAVPTALAMVMHDPGGTSDHDIPMLLQIADSRVRSQFKGQAARDETLARFSLNDPERFAALTNERSFR